MYISKSWFNEIQQAKIEEIFVNGLTQKCRLEPIRLNISTFEAAFNVIKTTGGYFMIK